MADEPGPPGDEEFDEDKSHITRNSSDNKKERERRRSPSPSPRRRSPRRERRSRSKSRNRNYSPPRRYGGVGRFRRSPDRNVRMNRSRSRDRFDRRRDQRRDRSRDRFRVRRNSRSISPRRHWSPNVKKPASPPPPPPIQTQPPPAPVSINPTPNAPQFTAPPPPIFNDTYTGYTNQYAGQTFPVPDYGAAPPPPPQFASSYPPPPSWSMPVPSAEVYGNQPPPAWPATNPQIAVPPQIQNPPESNVDQLKREAAVAQEVQNQREELKKQRNDYLKKATNMKKELKMLKDQMIELIGSGGEPPSPTTKGYIDENEKLQGQIQKKINTIENVIDMLSGIIGVDKKTAPPTPPILNVQQKKLKKKKSSSSSSSSSDDNSSPERLKTKIIESMKSKREASSIKDKIKEDIKIHDKSPNEKRINYIFYDPEMHWCKTCTVFPKTAKDYLNHLHSKEHGKNSENQPSPWHDIPLNDEFPNLPNAPSKRTPIRGLQFFVPSTSWFCKLCNFWMGDLHCASAHLKSKTHWECYNTFFQKNLTYEADWMAERQKSLDIQQRAPPPPPQITSSVSTSGMEIFDSIPLRLNTQKSNEPEKSSKKRKKKSDDKKDKKKKKRSKKRKKGGSSSSSSSTSSSSSSTESDNDKEKTMKEIENRASSIRVAMRNVVSEQSGQLQIPFSIKGDIRGKWETIHQPLSGTGETKRKDDIILSQWNTPQPIISESEKKLLEQLKGKLKTKPIEDQKKSVENGSSKTDKRGESRSKHNKSPAIRRDASPYRDRNNRSRSRGKKSIERNRSDRRSRSRARRSRSLDSRGRYRRSRSRNRRSRSRGGRISPYRRRRRSPSRERRRRSNSRSRSRSNGRRIEKPIVRYPEFRPRVPDQPEQKKKTVKATTNDEENERKKSPSTKKNSTSSTNTSTTNTSNNGSGKKLPFIGRMPVLAKKQQDAGNENSSEKKDDDTETNDDLTNIDHRYNYPNQAMMMQATAAAGYPHYDHSMIDYDDLMPDPMQYVTLMGAPPPPPPLPQQQYEDEKEILPPGIDETETEFVPKPISDAPIARKGPLPRDFEEALNIIFPGEKKPEDIQKELELKAAEVEAATAAKKALQHAELAKDGIHLLNIADTQAAMDEVSQMGLNDGFMKFTEHSQDVQDMALSDIPAPLPPPLPTKEDTSKLKEMELVIPIPEKEKIVVKEEIPKEISLDEIKIPSPTDSDKERRQQELDDLAMLGIDADDLAAQCI